MPPAHGAPVLSRMRKWDGTAHWTTELRYLGADAFGHWLGSGPGGRVRRPGAEFQTRNHHVRWVPDGAWFVAGFNGRPALRLYLDLTTPAELVELRYSMPSALATSRSSGVVMKPWIRSASAP